jgi:hypothetical protein
VGVGDGVFGVGVMEFRTADRFRSQNPGYSINLKMKSQPVYSNSSVRQCVKLRLRPLAWCQHEQDTEILST